MREFPKRQHSAVLLPAQLAAAVTYPFVSGFRVMGAAGFEPATSRV